MYKYLETLDFAKEKGVFSARQVAQQNLPQSYLRRMLKRGELVELTRGIYMWPEHSMGECLEIAVVSLHNPSCVMTGHSALEVHGYHSPYSPRGKGIEPVQLAVPRGARSPRMSWPDIEVFTVAPRMFARGVETVMVEGVPVQVYDRARLSAELFKFRTRLGIELARDVLRHGLAQRWFERSEVLEYARLTRVEHVVSAELKTMESF